jgi:hypothetical protein
MPWLSSPDDVSVWRPRAWTATRDTGRAMSEENVNRAEALKAVGLAE